MKIRQKILLRERAFCNLPKGRINKMIKCIVLLIGLLTASTVQDRLIAEQKDTEHFLKKISEAVVSRNLSQSESMEFLLEKGILSYNVLDVIYNKRFRRIQTILAECEIILPEEISSPEGRKIGNDIKKEINSIAEEINSLKKDNTKSRIIRFQRLSELEKKLVGLRARIFSLVYSIPVQEDKNSGAHYSNRNKTTILVCPKLQQPPKLDGILDDSCWKDIPDVKDMYMRNAPPGIKIKTTMKLGFDGSGLYIGAFCFKEDMKTLKAEVKKQGDLNNLWADDSLEIYIDPYNTPLSFSYFVVNAIGTQGDDRQDNAGSRSANWAPEKDKKWEVKTKVTNDGWGVEVMIPWTDIGEKAREGDVWTFTIIRFDWATKNWIAATTSPGALSDAKECFGFLYFGDNAQILEKICLTSEIYTDDIIFVYEEYEKLYQKLISITSVVEQCRNLILNLPDNTVFIVEVDNLAKEIETLNKEIKAQQIFEPADWQNFTSRLNKIYSKLEELLTRIIIAKMIY